MNNAKIPWHQNFSWWHIIVIAQACLLLNIIIIGNSPSNSGVDILSWIWLVGTIFGIYKWAKRDNNNDKVNPSGKLKTANQLPDMIRRFEALDAVESVANNVKCYSEKLRDIKKEERTNEQTLWLLAEEAMNAKFISGTTESIREALMAIKTLEENIPKDIE